MNIGGHLHGVPAHGEGRVPVHSQTVLLLIVHVPPDPEPNDRRMTLWSNWIVPHPDPCHVNPELPHPGPVWQSHHVFRRTTRPVVGPYTLTCAGLASQPAP